MVCTLSCVHNLTPLPWEDSEVVSGVVTCETKFISIHEWVKKKKEKNKKEMVKLSFVEYWVGDKSTFLFLSKI